MTEPTTELAQPIPSPSSSAEEKRKITLADLKSLHTDSRRIAAKNLPEHQGILAKVRNLGLEHKRRKLAKDISRTTVKQEKINREEQNRIENEGERDPLTSVYNRRGFTTRLVAEVARMKREEYSGVESRAVLMVFDANDFKEVNDNQGHDGGDRVLQKIATVLSEIARPTDIVARLGGDEFALFLAGADIEGAQKLFSDRMGPEFFDEGINISTGISEFNPYEVSQSKKNADIAMYAAKDLYKETGGNEIVAYKPGMVM